MRRPRRDPAREDSSAESESRGRERHSLGTFSIYLKAVGEQSRKLIFLREASRRCYLDGERRGVTMEQSVSFRSISQVLQVGTHSISA